MSAESLCVMAKWLPCLVLFLSFVPSESEDPVNVLDDLKPVSIAATESGKPVRSSFFLIFQLPRSNFRTFFSWEVDPAYLYV